MPQMTSARAALVKASRLVLIVNTLVLTILSFVCMSNGWPNIPAPYAALGSFSVTSMCCNIFILVLEYYRSRRIVLEAEEPKRPSFILILFDMLATVAFLVLFIITTIIAEQWYANLLHCYISIGALVAWILHLVSFASNGYNGYRYFIMDRPRCPHCHQKMSANWTLPRFVPTQTESASPPPGPSTVRGEDLIANDNEEGEGDRLIVKH